MRFISHYSFFVLLSVAFAAYVNPLPVHQALPARIVRTAQVGPVQSSANTSTSSDNHHVPSQNHASVPNPVSGTLSNNAASSDSTQNHPLSNSHTTHNQFHSNVAGPDAPAHDSATISSSHNTDSTTAALGPNPCEADGICASLGETVVNTAEGPECRALHITGKCSVKCLSALKEVLAHKLWNACATKCETDVVAGAANRWVELCAARQPTLLDASKEALQIVATAPGAGRFMQAMVLLGVLITAIALGYRRGILQGTALRLQKRLKRRSSERSLV